MAEDPAPQQIPPWTVKGMPMEDREIINRAAKRADQNVGEWLRAAAHLAIQVERNGMLAAPTGPEPRMPEAALPASRPGSVDVVERLAAVLPSLTTDARGGGKLAGLARRAIEQHLRALMIEDGPPGGPPRLSGPEDER